jgi:hypothetical protein
MERPKAGGMAENKTKPTKVSVASFIDQVADPAKRADAKALIKLMRRLTGEPPKMWGPSIIGFGTCHYKYDSGREGDMPLAGFSPRKPATVIYIMTSAPGSEALLAKLGKHSIGKSCLYIKKLADVDQAVLEALILNSIADTQSRYPS